MIFPHGCPINRYLLLHSFISASLASDEAFLVAFHQRLSEREGKSAGKARIALLCMIDVEVEFGKSMGMSYTSDEIAANIAYVNTIF